MKEVFTEMDPKDIECEYLNGVYAEIANLLGVEAALTMHTAFRGQQLNFPVNFFTSDFIREQVIREYDGGNVKQLATKYGYSEKWIRKILKSSLESEKCGQ